MDTEDSEDFVTQALKKHKADTSEYIDTRFVLPTSNDVERLFSLTKRVFSPLRQSLKYETLEMLIYLKVNRELWSVATVSQVRNKEEDRTEEEPEIYRMIELLSSDDEDDY